MYLGRIEWTSWDGRTVGVHHTYNNPIRIHNCMESMSNGQHGTFLELLTDGGLNQSIGPAQRRNCKFTQ